MIKPTYSGMNVDMSNGTATATTENNICMGGKFEWRNYATATLVSNNNISGDASADDQGGTGHLINKTATDQFVDYDTDWNLKVGADALDTGKTIGNFSTDALGKSRPQNAIWDIGALEMVTEIAPGRRVLCVM